MTSKFANHHTPQSLAAHYRKLADEARTLANATTFADLRSSYLRYEIHWRALADEADQQSSPVSFWQWLKRVFDRV